ncbi:MAG TPA: glycosyltransferase family A protein [Kiritimatiellia bacterium]|nr:glycosyltransferase family A protein [Kiritimatiellia bacterium]
MSVPRISVLLPVRNGAAHLWAALRSILEQSHRALEVLVLDDASADGSAKIAESFHDPRVRVLRFDAPQGLARLLNMGWISADGEYIARMDADDIAESRRLERQLAFLAARPALAGCGCWLRVFGRGRSFLARYPTEPGTLHAYALFDNPLAHPSVLLRREPFERENLRYNEEPAAAQDYELWSRALETLKLDNLPEPLLRYRQHADAVTDKYGGVSESRTLDIQRGLLARLSIEASEDERRFHRLVGHGAAMQSPGEMKRAYAWLARIAEANARIRRYEEDGLRRAIGFVWHRLALNSARGGAWAWRFYREAPFADWHQPGRAERFQMRATALLAPFRSASAARAGVRRSPS